MLYEKQTGRHKSDIYAATTTYKNTVECPGSEAFMVCEVRASGLWVCSHWGHLQYDFLFTGAKHDLLPKQLSSDEGLGRRYDEEQHIAGGHRGADSIQPDSVRRVKHVQLYCWDGHYVGGGWVVWGRD